MIHARTHPSLDVPGCYACRISSIGMVGHRVDPLGRFQRDRERHNDSELNLFERTVAEGSMPMGTQRHQSETAQKMSDKYGRPFLGHDPISTIMPEFKQELHDGPPVTAVQTPDGTKLARRHED